MTFGQAIPEVSQPATLVGLKVISNVEKLKGDLQNYLSKKLTALGNVRVTGQDSCDLSIRIVVIQPDADELDIYAISTLITEPFNNNYFSLLIEIATGADSTSALPEVQRKIIKDETKGKDLYSIRYNSLVMTSSDYLKKSCDKIIQDFSKNHLDVYRKNREIIQQMKSNPARLLMKPKK
jgi:hypothetical protein